MAKLRDMVIIMWVDCTKQVAKSFIFDGKQLLLNKSILLLYKYQSFLFNCFLIFVETILKWDFMS